MIRHAVFFLAVIFFTALTVQPAVAQSEVRVELTRDQNTTSSVEVYNRCSAAHTFELTDNPETSWVKIIGARSASIPPRGRRRFVLEFNSRDLHAGTYRGEAPVICIDCASEPRCGPSRSAVRLQMKVLWSREEIESWKTGEYVPGEILITLTGQSKEINRAVQDFKKAYQLKTRAIVSLSSTQVLVLFSSVNPGQSMPHLVSEIQRKEVDAVQLNFIHTVFGIQKRNYESLQYGPHLIKADLVSNYATGKGIRIALIDTGVDDNDDLKGKVIERKDFTRDGERGRNIHGTIMAGIINAIPHNGFGINGIAPDARIISIKVLKQVSAGTEPTGASFTIVQGVSFAIQKKVHVANMSFGLPRRDPAVANIVRTAVRGGVVMVAAAGNREPQGRPSYPAALSEVVAVSAVSRDTKAYASGTTGDYIDLAAPGVGILSTRPGNTFGDSEGSSEAAAHVTGVVALVLEKSPSSSPTQIQALLERTSMDLGSKGKDSVFGSGLVDACKSLEPLLGIAKICRDH